MNENEILEGWTWNENLAQWERGDFRIVKYNDDGRIYYRLLIRCAEHPELNASCDFDIDYMDTTCRSIVEAVKENRGIELKY